MARHQEQHAAAGWLFQQFQQAVRGVDIHGLGRTQKNYFPVADKRAGLSILNQATNLINRDIGASALAFLVTGGGSNRILTSEVLSLFRNRFWLKDMHVGMRAGREQMARLTQGTGYARLGPGT